MLMCFLGISCICVNIFIEKFTFSSLLQLQGWSLLVYEEDIAEFILVSFSFLLSSLLPSLPSFHHSFPLSLFSSFLHSSNGYHMPSVFKEHASIENPKRNMKIQRGRRLSHHLKEFIIRRRGRETVNRQYRAIR